MCSSYELRTVDVLEATASMESKGVGRMDFHQNQISLSSMLQQMHCHQFDSGWSLLLRRFKECATCWQADPSRRLESFRRPLMLLLQAGSPLREVSGRLTRQPGRPLRKVSGRCSQPGSPNSGRCRQAQARLTTQQRCVVGRNQILVVSHQWCRSRLSVLLEIERRRSSLLRKHSQLNHAPRILEKIIEDLIWGRWQLLALPIT